MDKKYLYVCLILIVLFFGVFIRIQGIENLKSSEGKYIPKNADSFYFLRLAESNTNEENFREGHNDISKERWWRFSNNVVYFPIFCFILLFLSGILIINYGETNYPGSLMWTLLISFSNLIFYRSSAGFFDHDLIGMFFFFLFILSLKISKNKKLMPITIIPLIGLYFSWMGLFRVCILFILLFILVSLIFRLRNNKTRAFSFIPAIFIIIFFILYKNPDVSIFVSENQFNIGSLFPLIFLLPLIIFSSYKSFIERDSLSFSLIITSISLIFFSNRMLIISVPLLFLISSIYLIKIKEIDENKKTITGLFYVLIIVGLILFPMMGNYSNVEKFGNDSWEEGMRWLRDNTLEEDKVLAWWDYGYYIQYMAKRKTITDGGGSLYAKNISNYFNSGDYSYIETLNASYLVIFNRDKDISQAILNYGNKEPKKIEKAFLFDLLDRKQNKDLKLVFENDKLKIFNLRSVI